MLSHARELMATGFDCPVPGNLSRKVKPAAIIFIGGKVTEFSGCLPGIMEEFLNGVKNERPIYLLGGFGGAAQILANAVYGVSKSRPPYFSTAHYRKDKDYDEMLKHYEELKSPASEHPQQKLDWLWNALVAARIKGFSRICRNGLSESDNKKLAQTTDTMDAVHLIWKGIAASNIPKPTAKRLKT